jgi:small subunit ribosomal protein S4e
MDARQARRYLRALDGFGGDEYEFMFRSQAPRPSPGPHKLRESLPLTIFLRYRLKYALTGREVISIVNQRLVKVDGKVRTDATYPAGFMGKVPWTLQPPSKNTDQHLNLLDVITIEKSGEHFRLLYDVKGRFTIHRITPEEASYKLLKVRKLAIGPKGVPYVITHDGRTIRYPDPGIKANDTVKFDIEQNKITDFVKFDTGNIVMITGGRNMGRAGVIVHREKHVGGFDIVHVKDSLDRTFATRYVRRSQLNEQRLRPFIVG